MLRTREEYAIYDTVRELKSATSRYGIFNSPHEGFAILKEEVDELWDEVKKNGSTRSMVRMRAEAKQVAAMALRFMVDCTNIGELDGELEPDDAMEVGASG